LVSDRLVIERDGADIQDLYTLAKILMKTDSETHWDVVC